MALPEHPGINCDRELLVEVVVLLTPVSRMNGLCLLVSTCTLYAYRCTIYITPNILEINVPYQYFKEL